jgi:hypothetical protein
VRLVRLDMGEQKPRKRGLTTAAHPMGRVGSLTRWISGRRGATTLEFAIISIPFLTFVLFVMELSYCLFTQEVVDSALHLAAHQIQTGNAQNATNGNDFITKYLAPKLSGLLSPANIYVQIKRVSPNTNQDYYSFTTGSLPMSGGSLDLSGFSSGSFCNSGPAQMVLISAIYIGPSIVGGLLPNILSVHYNGGLVDATLSTVGVITENYPPAAGGPGSASACI